MPKRKREDGTEGSPEASPEVVADPKQKRLQLKLHEATVKLGHAFRMAKGPERQKLGRRQKTAAAAKNEKDAQRVETEIAALKALDTTAAAQHHLYRCLLKIKAVASSPRLIPELTKLAPVQRDAATLNILSRLASSKPSKDALNAAIDDVQSAAGVVKKAPKREGSPQTKEKKSAPPVLNPLEITDEEDGADDDGDSEDEFGGFDDRFDSDGSDDDEDESMDDRPPPPPKAKASSFVPSLSVGYIAGSGSEPESDIEELAAPQKNRRGQRARQAIAEKKFGAKAKHLENPKNDRSQGWDAKRGATDIARGKRGADSGRGGRGGFRGGRGGFGGDSGRGGSFGRGGAAPGRFTGGDAPPPPKKKHNDDDGPLHPSWAAAKAAKEKKSAPVAFAGKRISFD